MVRESGTDTPVVILAGGEGSRMGGLDKCLLSLGGATILSRLITGLMKQSHQLYLNVNGDGERFAPCALPRIPDRLPGIGPLGGLASAMEFLDAQKAPCNWLLSVAGDCPFLPDDLLPRLLAAAEHDQDVIYCRSKRRDHFVIALWSRSVLPRLVSYIEGGGRSVGAFVRQLRHKKVTFEHTPVDPFFNINTEQHWHRAEQLLRSL